MKRTAAIVSIILLSLNIYAQTWQDTLNKLNNIFSHYASDAPGCQLAVSRNGKLLYSKACGSADLEHNIALTTNSVIEVGSVSKQFTAAAILLLEQQGKLSLNDDVRKYIPELPDYGAVIRIKHLIHHTSGLRDWGSIALIDGCPRSTRTYSNDDALFIVCNQKKLNNKPGEEMVYSNSNYNLLAILAERVSGMSLEDFTNKYIFEPANMFHSQWRDNHKKIVPDRAIAYSKKEGVYETDMPNEDVYGNCGLLTTTEDLLKWNNFYINGKLGKPSLFQKQIALDTLNNGAINHYAAGLRIQKKNDKLRINHSGGTAGYMCYLEYFDELKLSIAYICNSPEHGLNPAKEAEKIFVNSDETKPATQEAMPSVSNQDLSEYTGWYRNEKTGHGIKFVLKDNQLHLFHGKPLTQTNRNTFNSGETYYIFNEGRIKVVSPNAYRADVDDTTIYIHSDTAKLAEQNKKEYLGEYYSSEAQTKLSVIQIDNQLKLEQKPEWTLALTPTYYDGFYIAGINGYLYFERDKNNKISKMNISIERARNVEFERR